MIDLKKLKYDLAIQSALAATILNRRDDESVAAQMAEEFSSAYREYCSMNLTELKNELSASEQIEFESVNALFKSK